MDEVGPQFTLDASRADLTAAVPSSSAPELEVARTIVAAAAHEVTVIDVVRTASEPPASVVKRYDLWVGGDGLVVLPFDDDADAVVHGSVHRGSAASVAWSSLIAIAPDAPVQHGAGAPPPREFGAMADALQWFIDGVEQPGAPGAPSVGAELTVVLVSTGGQPWWYLVRLVDGGTVWGMAPASDGVALHPGRLATLWSRLAAVIAVDANR